MHSFKLKKKKLCSCRVCKSYNCTEEELHIIMLYQGRSSTVVLYTWSEAVQLNCIPGEELYSSTIYLERNCTVLIYTRSRAV